MRRPVPDNCIRRFSEITAVDVPLVGGKGANLGEMTRARLPVPPGFCLTAQAYRDFMQSAGAGETIRTVLAATRFDDPEQVEEETERIRRYLVEQPIPAAVTDQVIAAYRELANQFPDQDPLPVAVRSSATAEDLPNASFAGQQDTYLNIRGEDELLAHVKRCWASLWTARAVTYRIKQGFDHDQVALAVVVQAMIPSEIAGVMFLANPITRSGEEIVIDASWGLGEAIVSGIVTPDTFTVSKRDGSILSRTIADKDIAIQYARQGGTDRVAVEPERRTTPSLSDEQVRQLALLGRQIQTHYGQPMDVEWGFARDRFYVLQARPITTLTSGPSRPAPSASVASGVEYNRTMFVEIFPDPLSPIFLSAIQPLFHTMLDFTFRTLGFRPPIGKEAVGVYYNQPYFNRGYIAAALDPLSPAVRERMVQQMVNPFGRHEQGIHGELSISYGRMMWRLVRFMLRFPSLLPKILSEWRSEIDVERSQPVDKLPDAEIVDRIGRLVFTTTSRLLNYDFLVIALIGITYQTLGSLLERYFGSDGDEIRSKLISGVTGNVTMETNTRLWELSASAKRSPRVSGALRQYGALELRAELERFPEGQSWLKELDDFLDAYGHREVRMDILYPTWAEDPTPVLAFVRAYLDVGEKQSPQRQLERVVIEREELAHTVQSRVESDRMGRWLAGPLFRWVLENTQAHTRERDTMHFELTRLFPPFRRFLLELGRRWTERGLFVQPSDIFYLSLDEVRELAKSPRAVHEKVNQRRAELERCRARGAPGILRDGRATGAETVSAGETVRGQFRGIAGSPGKVSGIARVIRGPEEFHKLQSAEILVAPLTNPVWTPLFAIAGGLVTEVGGILSHGAIVAREYGIPAVMAVAGATKTLRDGQWITVDGNDGTVTIAGEAG